MQTISNSNCFENKCSPLERSLIVEKSCEIRLRAKQAREYLFWGSVNVFILAILLFDISNKCSFNRSAWYYLECAAAVFVTLSLTASFYKYFMFVFRLKPIHGTNDQRCLLQFDANDNSFMIKTPSSETESNDQQNANNSILSWHSSFHDSFVNSPISLSYTRRSITPKHHKRNVSFNTSNMNNSMLNASGMNSTCSYTIPYSGIANNESLTNEKELKEFLRATSKREEPYQTINNSAMNSIWSYCNAAASILKTSIYQLSPSTPPTGQNKQTANEEGGFNVFNSKSDFIKRISSEKLSLYVANLRRWLSVTILERIAKEIDSIDVAFRTRGFADMQIGSIGLDRLKKTAENQNFTTQFVPMLPLILPFLEMPTNQEYLVRRIKELSKGFCISDYLWNSGSSFHSWKWDEHLPTDSAILFHLFCVYMDSQLRPLPQGGGRPFFSRYVIAGDEKRSVKDTIDAVKNKPRCAILWANPLKPKFNFISDNEIHNCAYDRNNLFYVIIQFLIYMKTQQESMIEGVSLGKSGINIMCVIED